MIDNNPRKAIRSIARDMGVYESLLRHSVFLMQHEKGPIFITDHEGLEERQGCQAFFLR